MPNHRFKIGQSVLVSSDQPSALKPEGLHQIVRLMPISGRDPQYVVHSGADGYDRLVLESQLSLPKEPPLSDRPSPSQEQAIPRARSRPAVAALDAPEAGLQADHAGHRWAAVEDAELDVRGPPAAVTSGDYGGA